MAEDIHIRLDNPKMLRKEFLESALTSTEFLQMVERIQHFEQERQLLKTTFTQAMMDLTTSANQFIKSIPPLPVEFIQKQQEALHNQMMQRPTKILTPKQELAGRFQQKQPASFTSPLEDEINELRRKIQSLSV